MIRISRLMCVAAVVTVFAGCDKATGPNGGNIPEALTSLPRSLSVSEQQVISHSNEFAFALLRETLKDDTSSNIFLSPLSASMALGMTMNGARGTTLQGMQAALRTGALSLDDINKSYRSLIDLVRTLDSGVSLSVANSIWTRKGFPFEQSFFDVTTTYFDAQVAALDFNDPASVNTINNWVSSKTGGKIPTMIDNIPSEIVMYLMNAVYFKGSWRNAFKTENTRDENFTKLGGGSQSVKMMHNTVSGAFFQGTGVRGIELPYARGAFVMTIVLPDAGKDVRTIAASIDAATWNAWLATSHNVQLDVGVPRFRLDYKVGLNEALKRLGMAQAFSAGFADFTGMSPAGRDLYISEVKQKTFVNVNEEGTEAAAATSVGIGVTSAPLTERFIVDRPFIVAIRERFSGTLLFLGVIGAPAS